MNELQLFTYLKSRYIPDLLMNPDPVGRFDCESEQLGVYIELKSRQTHYDELMIERNFASVPSLLRYRVVLVALNHQFIIMSLPTLTQ